MRRLVCVMVVAALALAGCGATDNDEGGGVASGELRKLPGGAPAAARAAGGAEGAAADSAATSLLYPGFRIRYDAKPGLPDLRGPAAAYEAKADVDRGDVERLASAFGLKGTPKRVDDHSWHLQDGRRVAYVSTHGMGDWTISEAPTATSSSASCPGAPAGAEIACAPDAKGQPPVEPEIPTDLPSPSASERKARDLLAEAGADLADNAKATVSQPTIEGVTVSFEISVEGVPVPGLGPSITIGSGGVVKFASGTLALFDEIGEYPLVGTAEGVKRLQEAYGGAGEVTILGGREAIPDEQVGAGVTGSAGSSPSYDPQCDGEKCVIPEPLPPPEQQEQVKTVEGVELVLLPAYPMCPGQPMYLVPGYRFVLDGDEPGPVLNAVTAEHLVNSGAADRRSGGDAVEPCPGQGGGQIEPGVKPDEPVSSPPAGPAPDRPAQP